jgi:hypothetical protein
MSPVAWMVPWTSRVAVGKVVPMPTLTASLPVPPRAKGEALVYRVLSLRYHRGNVKFPVSPFLNSYRSRVRLDNDIL